MKRFGYFLLALVCPWLVLLMNGQLGRAFIAFMLQASLLGWPFATVWAWYVIKEDFLSSLNETSFSKTTATDVQQQHKKE